MKGIVALAKGYRRQNLGSLPITASVPEIKLLEE
jgi:hypothetical protein